MELKCALTVASHFENIELVQLVLDDVLARNGVEEEGRHWVSVAIREALANAIKHGNQQDPEKNVHVEMALETSEVLITVRDQGKGFDPAALEDPLAPENLLKPTGRGVFYMRRLMDVVEFRPRSDQNGMEVLLRKHLGPVTGEGPCSGSKQGEVDENQ